MVLNLAEIQGNVVPGFNKDHQAFVLACFQDRASARGWLGQVLPEVASAADVNAFNNLFKRIRNRRKHDGWTNDDSSSDEDNRDFGALLVVSATWINVALSWSGLDLVGGGFPNEPFEVLPPALRAVAQDVEPHVLLLLAADWADDLQKELDRQLARLKRFRSRDVRVMRGDALHGELRGHEHFGYADGISQPAVSGTQFGSGAAVASGEFVLGYPVEPGSPSILDLPEWAKDGSFLVVLKLRQDIATFANDVDAVHTTAGLADADQCGAAIVGRWKSGAAAGPHLADILRTGVDPQPDRDRLRAALPWDKSAYSHIGRANPSNLVANVNRHRLIRRGIPYTDPADDRTGLEAERGLMFLAYQANIQEQFEHVWERWLNEPNFPEEGSGTDPLVGQTQPDNSETREVTLDDETSEGGDARTTVRTRQFVTPLYAGYFFSPSLRALALLADSIGGTGMAEASARQHVIQQFFELLNSEAGLKDLASYLSANKADTRHISPSTHQHMMRVANSNVSGWGLGQTAADFKVRLDALVNKLVDTDLYSFIANEYPYPVYGSLEPDPQAGAGAEKGGPAKDYRFDFEYSLPQFDSRMRQEILHWELNGVVSNITKGIRLQFVYDVAEGQQRHGQLLIGYAGPPW